MEKENEKYEKIINKYNLDIEKLKKEQIKLSKEIILKDKIDFNLAETFAAIENTFIKNQIISCIIVCNNNFEIIDKAYNIEKTKFPYIPEFRNYRELPSMINAFEKLNEKPDLIFIEGHGISHKRLGLASHFSLTTQIPTIGISKSIASCEIKQNSIYQKEKKVGELLKVKKNSNPLYVSPGNLISIETAHKISEKLVKLPHKRPEPIHLASKYLKNVKKEFS